jgi:beta-glucosidase
VDIRGYFHWSTWDNFEWNLGPTKRFGLYECNLDTKERTPRPSAEIFRKLAYFKIFEEVESEEVAMVTN